MLGIIGAMDEEVLEIKNALTDVSVETVTGMDFYRGKVNGKEVVVVRSGIGKGKCGCVQPGSGRSVWSGGYCKYSELQDL